MNAEPIDGAIGKGGRIGIFGGTFDPVHNAHLLLAEVASEELELDRLLFLPAFIPPHKLEGRAITPAECRVEMLRLATAGNGRFSISPYEVEKKGVSYTVDTLEWLCERYPDSELMLLIGGDSARDFSGWRSPDRIASLASIAVWERPGLELPEELIPGVGYHRITAPLMELSSTDIRERIARDRSIRYRTPDAVIHYIEQHELYR